ncbi:MAG: MBL fold metallo-hydrolase [Flexilinea sp.]|nr:MBL fold metallo-hydrolase [Flexilinea sp.]
MQKERISENVYWLQSELYAQVTAGVIVGPQWAIVVDTLALPEETLAMREFIDNELKVPVRYLIDTHSHADHAWGNCFFPEATIIAHTKCAQYLATSGRAALEATKAENPAFADSHIVLPHLTFDDGEITLKVGKKNLIIMLTPGHTDDGISVFVEEDRILFAGDSFMPIPALYEGNYVQTLETYKKINSLGLENIVQGHGDIILRGEIDEAMHENITYLTKLKEVGEKARIKRNPGEYLSNIHVEDCGKSRVYLGGLAENLHKRNLIWIYKQVIAQYGFPTEDEYEPEPEDDDFDNLAYLDPNDLNAQNFEDDIDDNYDEEDWDDGYGDDDDED